MNYLLNLSTTSAISGEPGCVVLIKTAVDLIANATSRPQGVKVFAETLAESKTVTSITLNLASRRYDEWTLENRV